MDNMPVTKDIIENIDKSKIRNLLADNHIPNEDIDNGMEKHLLLNKLMDEQLLSEAAVNEFLYRELMYGHRRLVRVYGLQTARIIKRISEWERFLNTYRCDSMDFNRITSTIMGENEILKVAAMKTEEENGILSKVEILFVFNMLKQNRTTRQFENVNSYIPVHFDFERRMLMLRVWNREMGAEDNTPNAQLDYVFSKLQEVLDFETKPISNNPQHILYKMSKDLFENFFNQLPNIQDIEGKKECLNDIVNDMLSGIALQHVETENGKLTMNPGIIDMQEEVYKLIQQAALYDFLKDNSIKELLGNTDKYVARIRFNDKDNLSASLTGEKGVKCIYDTKTFMCIRNSLDLVENIVSIVVTFVKGKEKLVAKYDAADNRFLTVHILSNKYYSDSDFQEVWELYKKYESRNLRKVSTICKQNDITTARELNA